MHLERFERLMDGYLDGGLTAAELQELSTVLEADAEARDAFWRLAQTHSGLREWGLEQAGLRQVAATLGSFEDAPVVPVAFHGRGGRKGWTFVSDHIPLFSAVAVLAIAAWVAVTMHNRGPGSRNTAVERDVTHRIEVPASNVPPRSPDTSGEPPGSIARLTHVVACCWKDRELAPGEPLKSGQSLHLVAGVAELHFDRGVRVILQGPASLQIESADRARLSAGKLTALITSTTARGFQVLTPEATVVDEGTEFGVEVTPSGSRVHVFQGAVDLALNNKQGLANPVQRLTAHCGVRVERDPANLTLLEDTGESFIRSMDQADRHGHTAAYWRFEDRPLGVVLPDTNQNANPVRATLDSSFNGNDLFTFTPRHGPQFSGDVPSRCVPRTGAANLGCLDNTARPQDAPSRDLYSHSRFSHAAPSDLQEITPAEWTIEASVKSKWRYQGPQTFVTRDGELGEQAWLAFQMTNQDRFAVRFVDVERRPHEAVASTLTIQVDHWYHLAATSDGRTLKLYVDCQDGRGYQLQASAELPRNGSTALGKSSDPSCREWALGRIRVQNRDVDQWFQGWIDEVRISDVALRPRDFLFTPQESGKEPK